MAIKIRNTKDNGSGWHYESMRHGLAAKGMKTGSKEDMMAKGRAASSPGTAGSMSYRSTHWDKLSEDERKYYVNVHNVNNQEELDKYLAQFSEEKKINLNTEKIFILDSEKAFSDAEKFKAQLENEGLRVSTEPYGMNGVRIKGTKDAESSTIELPTYNIRGKGEYYRDVRLGEYRSVKNPSDRIRIDDVDNSQLVKPRQKKTPVDYKTGDAVKFGKTGEKGTVLGVVDDNVEVQFSPDNTKILKKHELKKTRIPKTKEYIIIQGNYGQGWEDVTTEEKYSEAQARLKEYNDNEPQYPHRKIYRREKIQGS